MDMKALMKQAKKMQEELVKQQSELEAKEYTGSVSNDMVKVVVSGKCEVNEISIDESLLEKDNKEMLEDMIIMATNQALAAMNEDKENSMGALTGGAKVPGLF